MNKVNFDKELQALIDENMKKGIKPKLLLHSCCAPCSSTCIERLKEGFNVCVYYYNPNIDTKEEFNKRCEEQQRLAKKMEVDFVCQEYDGNEFYSAVKGYENCPEGRERCFICYRLRLEKTAKYAKEHGYSFFATTLTLSPLKNSDKLNEIGKKTEQKYNITYLCSDFKKRNGNLRSIELSKQYRLYRQNYCGCIFSKTAKKEENNV